MVFAGAHHLPRCRFPILLGAAAFLYRGSADELAFGDVDADGRSRVRFLESPVAGALSGSFFESDAMVTHDWSHVRIVNKSFAAALALANANSSKIVEMEVSLSALFRALPKNDHGLLSNGTVRYALHRHFSLGRGWFIKGMEPAGASWVSSMTVTPDVKDISKYIVPTYMHGLLRQHGHEHGTDLRGLAIMVATFEHMIYAELAETLFHIYRTFGIQVQTDVGDGELNTVLTTFMMIFALGGNLDYSGAADVRRSLLRVEQHHKSWKDMMEWAQSVRREKQPRGPFSFQAVLSVIQRIVAKYSHWQSRHCNNLKELLHRMEDKGRPGHVPLEVARQEAKHPTQASGSRMLFNETESLLRDFGALEENSTVLIAPNYLYSQSMCVSTASYFESCCPNDCETLLSQLENEALGPTASPDQIQRVLEEGQSVLAQELVDELQDLAKRAQDGRVLLYSRDFSLWMHSAFPMRCPKPTGRASASISPKTPDEWMRKPEDNVEVMELMLEDVGIVMASFIGVLTTPEDPQDVTSEEGAALDQEVVKMYAAHRERMPEKQKRAGIGALLAQMVLAASTLCLLVSATRSGLQISRGQHGEVDKKGVPSMKLDSDFFA